MFLSYIIAVKVLNYSAITVTDLKNLDGDVNKYLSPFIYDYF